MVSEPSKTTLNQDLLAVINTTVADIAAAYGKMNHPLLVETIRDECYFGIMGKIGELRKTVGQRIQKEEAEPRNRFQQFLQNTDNFINDLTSVRALWSTANESLNHIAEKGAALAREEDTIEALDALLRKRFGEKSKGEPVTPLTEQDEKKLEQLDAQYGERAGESNVYQAIEGHIADLRRKGNQQGVESATLRAAEIRELALTDLGLHGCHAASGQLIVAVQECLAVQQPILAILNRYDAELIGRASERNQGPGSS